MRWRLFDLVLLDNQKFEQERVIEAAREIEPWGAFEALFKFWKARTEIGKNKSIDEAMQEMSKRVIALAKQSAWLEQQIKKAMEACNKEKIENSYHQVRLMLNNPRVEWSDKSIVPKEFWRHKVKETLEPDTAMINKALKEGIEVPGAYLVRDTRLSIR